MRRDIDKLKYVILNRFKWFHSNLRIRKVHDHQIWYLDQEGKLVLVFQRTAAVSRILPVQVQAVKATFLEEGQSVVSKILTTFSRGHHLGEGS